MVAKGFLSFACAINTFDGMMMTPSRPWVLPHPKIFCEQHQSFP